MDDRPGCAWPDPCSCGRYACELKAKAIGVTPAAQPSRTRNNKPRPMSAGDPFRRPIVYHETPSGHKLPILQANGQPLRRGQYLDDKAKWDARLAAATGGPAPVSTL